MPHGSNEETPGSIEVAPCGLPRHLCQHMSCDMEPSVLVTIDELVATILAISAYQPRPTVMANNNGD